LACADQADVLTLAGRPDEATAALREALSMFELKGNVVRGKRMTARLAELAPPP